MTTAFVRDGHRLNKWADFAEPPSFALQIGVAFLTDTDLRLAAVPARANSLSAFEYIRTIVRNPIEAWPNEVFGEEIYRSEFMKREALFVMAPDFIKEVLLDKADAFVKAEAMRRALAPALGDGILTSDGASWRWQRRAAAPMFRPEGLTRFSPVILSAAERTRDRWLALSPGTEIDVGREMMRTTFEIILQTMLSGQPNLDVERIEQSITDYLNATSWAIACTILRAPAWMPYPGKLRARRASKFLRSEVLRVTAERRRGTGRNDLLSLLLEARDPDTGRPMNDREIADNLVTFITAGHETTALALTWTFYLLSLHQQIEQRVVDEIETVTGGGVLGPDHAGALAFTGQVIQESMRLYPPAPIIVRAAARNVTIGGQAITRGTVGIFPLMPFTATARSGTIQNVLTRKGSRPTWPKCVIVSLSSRSGRDQESALGWA